jgi:hypothetical protein
MVDDTVSDTDGLAPTEPGVAPFGVASAPADPGAPRRD